MTNTPDPHAAWLYEWRSEVECLETVEDDSPEEAKHSKRRHELDALLANTPATTPTGLLAQLEWFKEDLGHYVTTMVGDDLNSCIDTLISGGLKLAKPETDPHIAWLEEWRRTRARWDETEDGTPEADELWAHLRELDAKIARRPATTPQGLASQLEWLKQDLGQSFTEMFSMDNVTGLNVLIQSALKMSQPNGVVTQVS